MDETIVGYELPGTWLFGEIAWRYCLVCAPSSAQTDPSARPLTRQQVDAECQAIRERGVEQRGPHRDWRGLQEEQCWVCGKYLVSGKKARQRPIDGLAIARRLPYPLRHILTHPGLLKSLYPAMTETERLEVVAYTTRQQRGKRSYQDLGTAERLAEAEVLLQRWHAWAGQMDGSSDWRFPPQAEKALTRLIKDTSRLIAHIQTEH